MAMSEIAQQARSASLQLQNLSLETRNEILRKIKKSLEKHQHEILEANAQDLKDCPDSSASLKKRLVLTEAKYAEMLKGLSDVESMEDPLGKVTLRTEIAEGMELRRVSCPIGVLAIIFEARPEAGVQIASLALKSGNALILKGGIEAVNSNKAIFGAIREALEEMQDSGVPIHGIQLAITRADINELLKEDKCIDLVIPRGSNLLVQNVKANTKIPVLGHADGICSIYVDSKIDVKEAVKIVMDSKTNYPAACNACETLLVHEQVAEEFLAALAASNKSGVKFHTDASCKTMLPADMCVEAKESDFSREFLSLDMAVKIVGCMDEAVQHINAHGSHHTDCIITRNQAQIECFQKQIDSACVFANVSTRFADGYRFGFGAEVGISTNKIHSRGPVGLDGLVIYKYLISGGGQVVGEMGDGPTQTKHHLIMPVADVCKIEYRPTTPVEGQLPGTSGLRRPVSLVVETPNFLENFFQAIFNAQPCECFAGRSMLLCGDGRYLNKLAIQKGLCVAAANGVSRVWVGQHGWMSTPAASACIRARKAFGGILLTASHNAGGPKGDFGIKYNLSTGAPAPEKFTNEIYECTKTIKTVRYACLPEIDISKLGRQMFELEDGNIFVVDIIDPAEDWMTLMENIFDFESLKKLVSRSDFTFCYDGLSGIAGPYAKKIFLEKLGAAASNLQNCDPLEDFGGCHPDPNLTYAKSLVKTMMVFDKEHSKTAPLFGAAGDGDNDRNMILGQGFFVTPSDSVAIIAHYATKCIPYYKKNGLLGAARSMPTSRALDMVTKKLGVPLYEVPTGWKYFGNLMDASLVNLCGEESFGTGSDHIREKDGLWAVLCWMSILAYRNPDASKPFVGVEQINNEFWKEYGRVFYTRYDYEEVSVESVEAVKKQAALAGAEQGVKGVSQFSYKDLVDRSVTANQGTVVECDDGSRIILRASGTGSKGATLRVYMETVETKESELLRDTKDKMEPLVKKMKEITQVEKNTGRKEPTVIT